jgi:hypothetical protein
LMGRAILEGGNPVWNPALARNNYWGPAGGPTTDVNWVEIAAVFAAQKSQYDDLIQLLPLEDASIVREAFENMATHYGDEMPNLDVTSQASVTVSVQDCHVPVINVSFPVIVVPVDFDSWATIPWHTTLVLTRL